MGLNEKHCVKDKTDNAKISHALKILLVGSLE